MVNTLVFATVVTFSQTFLALMLAIALNQRIRGLYFFRAGFYFPSILSSVVVGLIFIWFTFKQGVVNFMLTLLNEFYQYILAFLACVFFLQVVQVLWKRKRKLPAGWGDPLCLWISLGGALIAVWILGHFGVIKVIDAKPVEIVWLQTRDFVLGIPRPLWAIMALNIFTTIPTMTIFFLAGLQDIPAELYEVAELDGASPWVKLVHITIPALRPVLFLVITLGLIGTMQMFDQAAITAGVAPLESVITLAYYVYHNMFGAGRLPQVGLASAAAMFLALLTFFLVFLQRRFGFKEKGWYE